MRAAREHPRLVVAKALGMLCLVGCGFALGLLVGGGEEVPRSTQLRLLTAERTARSAVHVNRDTRAQLARERAARAHAEDRLRVAKRNNVKLRRNLRVVRRALLRERRRADD